VRCTAFVTILAASILPWSARAQEAEPVDSAPNWSLSLERFASVNAVFLSLDDGSEDVKLRTKGITAGGPIANPLGAPRLSVDYLSKLGVTFGAGLAFALGDLDSADGGRDVDEGGYGLLMLAPRIGYRVEVSKWFDLTPRAGMTVGWARFTGPEQEYCEDYYYEPASGEYVESACTTEEGNKFSMFAAVANLELAATVRLTDSFNLLAGLSYDLLVAAHAKEQEGGDSGDSEKERFEDGHLSSLQLWLGLGGYL
jgi:hypothetical protein